MSAIYAEGLTKRYGSTVALEGLDMDVQPGEVYGYLGPNGAGKTTTIRMLLGLHRPTAGRAALFGVDAWRDPVTAHRHVAYVPGEPFLWPALTGAETFAYLARLHGGTDVAYRDELARRFELDTSKRVRALSKGNRQKVQLIAALATRRPAGPRRADPPASTRSWRWRSGSRSTRPRSAARPCSCRRTSSARSRRCATASASCAPAAGRRGDARAAAPPERADDRGHVRRAGPDLDGLPGVHVAHAGENALRIEVSGSVGPVISALAPRDAGGAG